MYWGIVFKKVVKDGGSWKIILPKDLVEFYKWENAEVRIEFGSDEIIIRKIR